MRKFFLLFCLLLFAAGEGFGQDSGAGGKGRVISGKVTDKESVPLEAVTVVVVGTRQSVMTDQNGNFKITAENGQVIKFGYLGADPFSYTVTANSQNITITMNLTTTNLEQVVVTGYQKERKKDITGAVNVVDVKSIKDIPAGNPVKALQGRVPGVTITTDGSPSGGATVRIRGIGSLGNNNPLYVIDGVPTTRGLQELNPNDIESIQVLKDASSATIYGSRAASGVIIVTTKKGKAGFSKVDVNVSGSIQDYATKLKTLDADGRGRAYWQASVNDKKDPNLHQIYKFDWNNDMNNPVLNSIIYPEFIDNAKTMRPADTYWYDLIAQNSVIQSYDVSISNGTEKGSSLFSLGYYKNKGIVKTSQNEKFSVRVNSDYNLFDGKLKIGQNLTGNYIKNALTPVSDILFTSLVQQPIVPVYTVNGGWGGPASGMTDRQNPVRLIEDNRQNFSHFFRVLGNAFADYNVIPGMNLRTSIGIDYDGTYQRTFRKSYTSGFLEDKTNQTNNSQGYGGNIIWQNTLNYKLTEEKHQFEFLLGHEQIKTIGQSFSASRQGYALENIDYAYLGVGTSNIQNDGGGSSNSLLSVFGKVNYIFNDRYIASVTLRRDGSSRFGKDYRYGTFPAFSVGWRVSEEEFLKKIPVISDLKLRYGWGKSGNQEIPDNANRTLYRSIYGIDPTERFDTGSAYDIDGGGSGQLPSGFTLIQRGNDALKWESLAESNIGVDFGFFDNKLTGSFDYFFKETSDILIKPSYLAVLGEGGDKYVNGATLKNRGFDALLSYNTKLTDDLSMNLTGNFSKYVNEVVKLPKEVLTSYPGNGTDKVILGRPVNSFFGYVTDGLFQNQQEVDAHAAQPGKGIGRIRYRDLNGDGVINDRDRDYLGDATPNFTAGLNASFSYKNFDLSFFIQAISVKVTNEFKTYTDFSSIWTGTNWGARTLDAWTPSNTSSTIPALTLVDNNNENRSSNYFIENGSYVKLRNLQLGYNLKNVLKSKVQNARIFIQGSNLITIKSKSFTGPDPEIPNYAFPVPVVGTIGLNITL